MKAVAVTPGDPDSLALIEEAEPEAQDDHLIVEAVAVGICGTDHEIIESGHGSLPRGSSRLVLGHESLGRVVAAPAGSSFEEGDLIVGVVRRPDPVPCDACARDRADMCLNGEYLERGIKGLDGYASERYSLDARYAVKVAETLGLAGVLVEPTSIVAKAWRRILEAATNNLRPIERVLVTGAGPIGLLAALIAAQHDFEVHVLDRVTEGVKPKLVGALGGTYHSDLEECPEVDAVVEGTGAASLIPAVLQRTRPNSVSCLTGVSGHAEETIDVGALNREIVLENDVVLGSVNASHEDFRAAMDCLTRADPEWTSSLITRRVALSDWRAAYDRRGGDVKTVLQFNDV